MLTIENDFVVVDQDSSKLLGFRLEDTVRAPAIIVFVDDNKPELLPLRQGQTPPTKVKSKNMVADIQIITYGEINEFMQNP
ncbi:MAG: hypothetical protein JZU50_06190 [Desulfobulbaceae bacterium]|nr:hypothetical protein [Desulfobulbaceae bacterium]